MLRFARNDKPVFFYEGAKIEKVNLPVKIIAGVVLIALLACVFANSMTKPLGPDEHMYCSGAVLLNQGKMIYRDFSYTTHLPWHALILSGVYKALDTNYYLLVGRMVSVVCDALIILLIVAIYRKVFYDFRSQGTVFGLLGAILYVFNRFVIYANGFAWNHDMGMLLVIAAFWVFLAAQYPKNKDLLKAFFIGALVTLATCMRVTNGAAGAVFFIAIAFSSFGSYKKNLKHVLAFLVGASAVLVWPIYLAVNYFTAIRLNLFKIYVLSVRWLKEAGFFVSKSRQCEKFFQFPDYLILFFLIIFTSIILLIIGRKIKGEGKVGKFLAIALVVSYFAVIFVPPVMRPLYFAMPVAFVIIILAYPLCHIVKCCQISGKGFSLALTYIVVGFVAIFAMFANSDLFTRAAYATKLDNWEPLRVHKVSQEIIDEAGMGAKVLTLGPLFALEGGGEIYEELSAGRYAYRVVDRLSEYERQISRTAGPATIGGVVEKSLADVVIAGVEPNSLEDPLLDAAAARSWRVEEYEEFGLRVYFRP